MRKVSQYRANAAECRRMAHGIKNALERRMWCDMSKFWLGMIGHAERKDFAAENVSTVLTSRSQSPPIRTSSLLVFYTVFRHGRQLRPQP